MKIINTEPFINRLMYLKENDPEKYEEWMKVIDRSNDLIENYPKHGPYTKYLFDCLFGRTNVSMKEFLKNVIPKG